MTMDIATAITQACFLWIDGKQYRITGHDAEQIKPNAEDVCIYLLSDDEIMEDVVFTYDELCELQKNSEITFLKAVKIKV